MQQYIDLANNYVSIGLAKLGLENDIVNSLVQSAVTILCISVLPWYPVSILMVMAIVYPELYLSKYPDDRRVLFYRKTAAVSAMIYLLLPIYFVTVINIVFLIGIARNRFHYTDVLETLFNQYHTDRYQFIKTLFWVKPAEVQLTSD